MAATAVAAPVWPTLEDFMRMHQALADGVRAVEELVLRYGDVVNEREAPSLRDGAPIPTAYDVGVLATVHAHADLELSTLTQFVEQLGLMAKQAPFEIGVA